MDGEELMPRSRVGRGPGSIHFFFFAGITYPGEIDWNHLQRSGNSLAHFWKPSLKVWIKSLLTTSY